MHRKLMPENKNSFCNITAVITTTGAWLWWLVARFQPRGPGLDPRSDNVEFVVDEVVVGRFCSKYFYIPFQFSFHQHFHAHLS